MLVTRIAESDLDALRNDWNRLATGNPFRSFEWLSTWWQYYRAAWHSARREVELYTLVVSHGTTVVGIAPWYMIRSRRTGTLLGSLGDGEACSDFVGVLCAPGEEAAVGEALAEWLAQAVRRTAPLSDRWETLYLSGAVAADPTLAVIAARFHREDLRDCQRYKEHTWRIELPSSWDGYLELVSKSHRKQLRQWQRRLFDTGQAVFHTATDAASVANGWNILSTLHQKRWNALGERGCFASEVYRNFHRAATSALFAAGRLRLHWIELDGRPIAAEYHLASDDTIYAYQGGIESSALEYEPGRLATMAALKMAIQQQYRAFDFCRGDELYKAHWRAVPAPSVEWRIVADSPAAKMRHRVWSATQRARRVLKTKLRIGSDQTTWRTIAENQ